MPTTTLFSGPLAVNANSGPQVLVLTPPFDGVTVSLFVQMNGTDGAVIPEVDCAYQLSLDGGNTYSDWLQVPVENEFSSTGNQDVKTVALDTAATHLRFMLTNRDNFNTVQLATLEVVQTTGGSTTTISASAVRTTIVATTTSVQLLAANPARKSFELTNDTTSAFLYLSLGSSGTVNDFTIRLAPSAFYEQDFAGPVWGVWDSAEANGAAVVTDLT